MYRKADPRPPETIAHEAMTGAVSFDEQLAEAATSVSSYAATRAQLYGCVYQRTRSIDRRTLAAEISQRVRWAMDQTPPLVAWIATATARELREIPDTPRKDRPHLAQRVTECRAQLAVQAKAVDAKLVTLVETAKRYLVLTSELADSLRASGLPTLLFDRTSIATSLAMMIRLSLDGPSLTRHSLAGLLAGSLKRTIQGGPVGEHHVLRKPAPIDPAATLKAIDWSRP